MRFARWVFLLSGASGVLIIVPPFFLEARTSADYPPPITHPEYYYGFFGITLAWQFMFLVIGSQPVRYRLAMLPAILEKASFAIAIPVLYARGRVPGILVGFSAMDATWMLLFIAAFLKTPREG
jgi:hypothetical protein